MPSLPSKGMEKEYALGGEAGAETGIVLQWLVNQLTSQGEKWWPKMTGGFSKAVEWK